METEELETGDEGLGSECSSESGSSSHRGLETGVYPSSYACSIDSLPLVLGSSYGTTLEVNRSEGIRTTWNGAVDLNGSVVPQKKTIGKVAKEETNYQSSNVRYIVYGKAASAASHPEKQNFNYLKKASPMNENSATSKRFSRGKPRIENESNGYSSCDFTQPEPFKYITVWRPYSPENAIQSGQIESTNKDEHFCKAITHFAYTPRLSSRQSQQLCPTKKVNGFFCIPEGI